MKNIKLVVEYDGSNYHGWQRQEGYPTIQEKMELALREATGEDVDLIGSGRTDKLVHATGQVCNFKTESNIPGFRYKYLMDFLLPDDITILESEEVPMEFHSRFSATGKRYRYLVYNGELKRALIRNFSYHYPHKLNLEDMRYASKYLIGTHDFSSFKVERSEPFTTLKTIYNIEIVENGQFIEFIIEGKSFLHNMVRIIVGTLLYIGSGKMEKTSILNILEGKNRKFAGITAPAQGLYLEKVFYD